MDRIIELGTQIVQVFVFFHVTAYLLERKTQPFERFDLSSPGLVKSFAKMARIKLKFV